MLDRQVQEHLLAFGPRTEATICPFVVGSGRTPSTGPSDPRSEKNWGELVWIPRNQRHFRSSASPLRTLSLANSAMVLLSQARAGEPSGPQVRPEANDGAPPSREKEGEGALWPGPRQRHGGSASSEPRNQGNPSCSRLTHYGANRDLSEGRHASGVPKLGTET
jgi:hypothetical protein